MVGGQKENWKKRKKKKEEKQKLMDQDSTDLA
jgi:hypothetical protein